MPKVILRTGNSSDIHVYAQVWLNEEYKPAIDRLKALPQPEFGYRIIDAGANIGLTTLYFAHHLERTQIAAIEADYENFKILNSVVPMNIDGIKSFVMVWNKAIHNNATDYMLRGNDFRDKREWSVTFKPSHKLAGKFSNPITIDQILNQYKWGEIDLLKIDIEGGEQYLFADDASAHATLSRTRTIAIEIHEDACPGITQKIYDYLVKYKFDLEMIGETIFGVKL